MTTTTQPADCICRDRDYPHTSACIDMDDATIAILIDMEDCPAERRALRRCMTRP